MDNVIISHGDCLSVMRSMDPLSVDLTITSPPYNIGKAYESKSSLVDYLEWHSEVISQVARITKQGGSICWQVGNHIADGAVYPLDCLLFGEFIKCGLIPRNRIVWTFGHGLHCKNRFSGRHETILWFSKGEPSAFNLDPVRVPQKYPSKRHYKGPKKGQLSGNPLGKSPGDVWDIPNVKHNHPEKTDHPCQFPEALSDRLVLALSNAGGVVFDPFCGSGTVGVSAAKHGRKFAGVDSYSPYIDIASSRIAAARAA